MADTMPNAEDEMADRVGADCLREDSSAAVGAEATTHQLDREMNQFLADNAAPVEGWLAWFGALATLQNPKLVVPAVLLVIALCFGLALFTSDFSGNSPSDAVRRRAFVESSRRAGVLV
jgi:hypothetical protein